MFQTQSRGEQGDEDQWLEIQHLRELLRIATKERDEARDESGRLKSALIRERGEKAALATVASHGAPWVTRD